MLATPRSARVLFLTGKMWDESSRKSTQPQISAVHAVKVRHWILSHFGQSEGGKERKTTQKMAKNRVVSKLRGMTHLFSSIPSSHDEHIVET